MTLHPIITESKNFLKELRNAIINQSPSDTPNETREQAVNNEQNQMNIKLRTCTPALLVTGLLAFITACSSSNSQPQTPPPTTVTVSAPLQETITQYDQFTGRFRAVERVEIRARVDGYLEEIKFRDGQLVEKGDVLFVIDQRPYKIALEQARAELESAQTRLELAEKELRRAQGLRSSGAVSQELIDRRNQEFLSARSAVSSAEAALHAAQLNLEFTKVKAPVSGKISENFVSVGNLISGGLSSATVLTRIVSYDPIYFSFETSEQKLIRYLDRRKNQSGATVIRDGGQTVMAKLLGQEQFTHRGKLDFIDNEIDPSTGTLLVRAVFPNDELRLMPGMFAKAQFSVSGRHRELLIPDRAIASDQSLRYVLTVDDSSKVRRKVVRTGPLHQDLRIIEEGLSSTDRVIINGAAKVRPGQIVNVNKDKIALAAEDQQP